MHKQLSIRAFIIAFSGAFFALTVLGMAAVLMAKPVSPPTQASTSTLGELYLPQAEDVMNVLIIGIDDTVTPQSAPKTFMLLRFDPQKGRIPILTLPGNTLFKKSKTPVSLSSIYNQDGLTGLKQSFEETYGILIDRYAKVPLSHFERIVNLIGTIRFKVPRSIALKQGDITIQLSEGNQQIDGSKASVLIQYPDFLSELERCATISNLCQDAINQHINLIESDMSQRLFTGVVNLMDTDISSFDYESKKRAAAFMSQLQREPALAVELQFSYDAAADQYSITNESESVIKNQFGVAVKDFAGPVLPDKAVLAVPKSSPPVKNRAFATS